MEETSMDTSDLDIQNENGNADTNEESICTEEQCLFESENVDLCKENISTENQCSFEYPTLFCNKTLLELCNASWSSSPKRRPDVQPYLRGCKWSPDGTCCLTVVNNDGVHIEELPVDLYSGEVTKTRPRNLLDSVVHVKEAGLVYDFCWYPAMNSHNPESCCWITTMQNAPIQMWDGFNGSLRSSYRGFDSVDEMETALSVTFSDDGSKIIGGYKKCLRTFDVNRPGREYAEHKISSPASCLATDGNHLAVGSWNTSISLYKMNEMGTYKSTGKLHGHGGGVTHMKFAANGLLLVSGARKDNRLLVWDIRYHRRPLNILTRVVDTNQRIYFDISPCGNYLVSGGSDGILRVWDMRQMNWHTTAEDEKSIIKFPLHNDCCNSVSIHPLRPIMATGSGQYHFTDPIKTLDAEDKCEYDVKTKAEQDDLESNMNMENDVNNINKGDMKYSSCTDNSLVFWWTGDIPDLLS